VVISNIFWFLHRVADVSVPSAARCGFFGWYWPEKRWKEEPDVLSRLSNVVIKRDELLLLLVVELMNANHVMQEMVFLEAEKEEFEGRRNDYYWYVLTDAGKTTHHGAVINVHLFIFWLICIRSTCVCFMFGHLSPW